MHESKAGRSIASAFDEHGYYIEDDVLSAGECDQLAARVEQIEITRAGTRRALDYSWCRALAATIRRNATIAEIVPADYVAVQCTLFSKSREMNWAVAPHRDLSIPVASKVDDDGCTGWSEKEGALFTQPPAHVLAQLVAVRVHVDDCAEDAGALRVIPGSHRTSTLAMDQSDGSDAQTRFVACAVRRGGVMLLRPALIHSSSQTLTSSPRRILHFLFGPRTLPLGLRWARAV